MLDIIKFVSTTVEEACKKKENIFGYEIWTYHIISVVKYSLELGYSLGGNLEILELSALLHDYASVKDKEMYPEHHIHGAREAEILLSQLGYCGENIERIKACIMSHRGSLKKERTTIEALILSSADAMAHIENVFSLFFLAYSRKKFEVSQGTEWVMNKIEKSWEKMIPEAKDIIKDKYLAIKALQ